ncbi:MAG: hypothetical protein KC492_00975 [Myxococcales bacterium]|nr:hypothetical protein [Myxococcales bacterium]
MSESSWHMPRRSSPFCTLEKRARSGEHRRDHQEDDAASDKPENVAQDTHAGMLPQR